MSDYELYHHGILGQKWGVRRYQNGDGTLTNAGRKRYDTDTKNKTSIKKENDSAIVKKVTSSTEKIYEATNNKERHESGKKKSHIILKAVGTIAAYKIVKSMLKKTTNDDTFIDGAYSTAGQLLLGS